MRISDWSSDVCSSDLQRDGHRPVADADRRTVREYRAENAARRRDGANQGCRAGRDRRRKLQRDRPRQRPPRIGHRSEEHTSELQSLMRTSYAVLGLKQKKVNQNVIKRTYIEEYTYTDI